MIITSPHYNRPHCTYAMIESLKKTLGIEDAHVIFVCEPASQRVIELCQTAGLPSYEVILNDSLLGLWETKKKCLKTGFERGNFVIHLEDDLIFSRDILLFYKWASLTYAGNPQVLNVSPFNKIAAFDFFSRKCNSCGKPFYGEVKRRERYTSIGFATWRDRYEKFALDWNGADHELEKYRQKTGMHEVYPTLSRINHIGYSQGVEFTDELASEIIRAGQTPAGLSRNHTVDDIQWHSRPPLLTNPDGREWVKMKDGVVRSRESEKFYREKFFLGFWADSIQYEFGGFFE